MHIFKFNFQLCILKNLANFFYKFFINLAKIKIIASLVISFNYFKTLLKITKY